MTDRIATAREALADERRTIEAEREAFSAFARRVDELETVSAPPSPGVGWPSGSSGSSGTASRRVRRVYAETVMAVDHYEREYGDTVAESVTAELGPEIAAALRDGSALTPPLRDAVLTAAANACQDRTAFLDLLDREEASLADAADAVADVRADLDTIDPDGAGFNYLRLLRTRTADVASRTERIATRRQAVVDDHRRDLSGMPEDLPEYLYADLQSPYPVLAAVADLRGRIDDVRRRVDRAIAAAP